MPKFLFWFSLLFIAYVYIGYPALLWIGVRIRRRPVLKRPIVPRISVVVAVHNEQERIGPRLQNLISLDYPPDLYEILVCSDGSTDRTEEEVQKIIRHLEASGKTTVRIRLLASQRHVGKSEALNRGVAAASGSIVVFADARQKFHPSALRELAANFSDPAVGSASGELVLSSVDAQTAGREEIGLYWSYEKRIRKLESEFDSMLGATGAIYAIRRTGFEPAPPGTLLDDVLIPMRLVLSGYRAVFDPQAIAYDSPMDLQDEFRRKVRTLTGNYQILFQLPALCSPFKNRVFFQYLSHKVGRLCVPFALVLLFVSNLFIPEGGYLVFLFLQGVFYVLAVAGGVI